MSIRAFTTIRLLTTVLLLAVSVSMNAQTETTIGNVVYTLIGDDHYEATALATGAEPATLTIASKVGGLPVTAIGSHAFDHCTSLTDITLPASLTAIGDYAFIGCNGLTSLTLPASLTTIGQYAFYSCQGLTDLSLCGTGLTLRVSAFADCTALRRITITGAAPTLENAVFNKVGSSESPALFRIDLERLSEFLALTQPVADVLRFQEAYGTVAFQVVSDGLRYTYHPSIDETPATYELTEIFAPTLPLQAATSYLISPPSSIGAVSVTSIATTGAFVNDAVNSRLYAIDLRNLPLSGLVVSRSNGVFAGVADHTLIYLPEGNSSDDDNVIVNGETLHHIKVNTAEGDKLLSSADILSGQATWMLCQQWGAQFFGQRIGTDLSPLPLSDLAQQRVWQTTFLSAAAADIRQYRYANTGDVVALPSITDMGYEATDVVHFYIDRDDTKPFTATTPVSADLSVYALPQASAVMLNETAISVRMSKPIEQRTFQLSATILPASAIQSVGWTSSDASVATVTSNGVLTVVGGGSATITCTSIDNPSASATCQVTAIPLPQSITISPTEIHLSTEGDSAEAQLSATILPAAAVQEFTWESTNEQIVTVDASGHIKGVAKGKAHIYVYPKDYPSMYAICYVSVGTTTSVPDTGNTNTGTGSDDNTGDNTGTGSGSGSGGNTGDNTGTGGSNTGGNNNTNNEIFTMVTDDSGSNTVKLTHTSASQLSSGRTINVPKTVTIGGIDYQVTAIADDALDTPTNNTMIYIPYGITYNGSADNVIQQQADGQNRCRRLVITDGCDFSTQHTFTADELIYHRTLTARNKPYAICLPYAKASQKNELTFYQFDHMEGDCMVMVSVPRQTEAYVPYLVFADKDYDDLGGKNVTIEKYMHNTSIYSGGYGMVGAMRGANNSESTDQSACVLSDDGQLWLPCATDTSLSILPLRSWVWHQGTSILGNMSFRTYTPPTGINNHSASDTSATPYYDLQGRCIGTSLDAQPRGIYLREGKKYVKR